MTSHARQIPLALRWPPRQRFAQFRVGPGNAAALAAARALADSQRAPWTLLSGPAGSGKTHLLMAACQDAQVRGHRARYASVARIAAAPTALRALDGADLLALDDLDALAGSDVAEHALFDLYNRMRAEGAALLLAARSPLPVLPLALPDLRSRLGACVQVPIAPLDEAARRALVRDWATERGLALEPAVLDWLFARAARDLSSLHALFERIDHTALARQRGITIPLLRELLAGSDHSA